MGLRTRRFRNERLVVLVGLGGASALCLGLELVREHRYALDFRFLVWNLFLAWIPLLLSLGVYDAYRRGRSLLWLSPMLALWLLFLPNAPYIVTDFVHLSASSRAPLWFDGVELSAFAWDRAAARLRLAVPRPRGSPLPIRSPDRLERSPLRARALGRGRLPRPREAVEQLDLLTQPGQRLAELHAHVADPAGLAKAIAVSAGVTSLLAASYLVFYLLMGARIRPDLD